MVILRRRTGGQGDRVRDPERRGRRRGILISYPDLTLFYSLGRGRSGYEIRGIRKGKKERAGSVSSKRVERGRSRGKLRNNICLIFRNRKGLHKRWKPGGSRECKVQKAEGLDPPVPPLFKSYVLFELLRPRPFPKTLSPKIH